MIDKAVIEWNKKLNGLKFDKVLEMEMLGEEAKEYIQDTKKLLVDTLRVQMMTDHKITEEQFSRYLGKLAR